MHYRGIKYYKLTNSSIIFYEVDNYINSDENFFKKINLLLEIVSYNKPKYLIINRIGSTYNPDNNILEIKDILLIENFKSYGIKRIFLVESEKENKLSTYDIDNEFVVKLEEINNVYDYIKEQIYDKSLSV